MSLFPYHVSPLALLGVGPMRREIRSDNINLFFHTAYCIVKVCFDAVEFLVQSSQLQDYDSLSQQRRFKSGLPEMFIEAQRRFYFPLAHEYKRKTI